MANGRTSWQGKQGGCEAAFPGKVFGLIRETVEWENSFLKRCFLSRLLTMFTSYIKVKIARGIYAEEHWNWKLQLQCAKKQCVVKALPQLIAIFFRLQRN